jgi:hypothetical protein
MMKSAKRRFWRSSALLRKHPDRVRRCGVELLEQRAVLATLTLASGGLAGAAADAIASDFSQISGNGRYLAFVSAASNLVPGDTNQAADVFVFDKQTGTTVRASVDSNGVQQDGQTSSFYRDVAISSDGRYVSFYSNAKNLTANAPSAGVYVHDMQTGQTSLVSVDSGGNHSLADSGMGGIAMSQDGRYVAFSSYDNLAPASGVTFFGASIFVRDRVAGTTDRVTWGIGQTAPSAGSYAPAISDDGRYVAYQTSSANIVAGQAGSPQDNVFVYDRQTHQTVEASVSSAGSQGNGSSDNAALSGDGRYVAFDSASRNLVASDTNAAQDVFVRDLQTGATTRVSVAAGAAQSTAWSQKPDISSDGRYVAFESVGSLTGLPSTNSIYVYDRQLGFAQAAAVSAPLPSSWLANFASSATISDDGQSLALIDNYSIYLWNSQGVSNTPPTISAIAARSTRVGVALSISFAVGDAETAATALTVTGASSNAALVPSTALQFSGSGAGRTLVVTPLANQTGMSAITLTVTDGNGIATPISFNFWVNADAWQNPRQALDVNGDGSVLPLDALLVINDLNANGSRSLTMPAGGLAPANFLDVSGDNSVAPIDVILIINYLNAASKSLRAATAGPAATSPVSPAASSDSSAVSTARFITTPADSDVLPALISLLSEDRARRR